jgi:hypothetical protein
MSLSHRKKSVDFSSVTTEEAREFVEFHNSYFSVNRTVENWLWQYAGYRPDKAIFAVLRNGKELMATQGMMPIPMNVGGEIALSGKSENTLLLPKYIFGNHMKGLYDYALDLCRSQGMDFIWGFTAAVNSFKRYGFEIYNNTQWFKRPGKSFRLGFSARLELPEPLWRRLIHAAKYIVEHFAKNRTLKVPDISKAAGYEVSNAVIQESAIADLYARLRSRYPKLISLAYDDDYLSWRLRKHPFLRYKEYQVTGKGTMHAYAFVVLSKGKAKISDLTSDDPTATRILLHRIMEDYLDRVESIAFFTNSDDCLMQDVKAALKEFHFSPSPLGNFVLKDLSGGRFSEELRAISNWHINGLWTDGFSL